MGIATPRSRPAVDHDDDWLIDAVRRAGYRTPRGERPTGISAWRLLLGAGVSDEDILRVACEASGAEVADFSRVSPAMRTLLPHDVALEHRVAPVGVHAGILAIGTVNPQGRALERALAFASKQRVKLLVASPGDILRAQAIIYGSETYGATFNFTVKGSATLPTAVSPRPTPVSRISVAIPIPAEARDERTPSSPATEPTNSPDALLTRLMETALNERASEATIEPTPQGGFLVRLRIDGKLNDRFRTSEQHGQHLMKKLETIAKLDQTSSRVPRSGRATFAASRGRVDLRVATEPVGVAHERMIVRLYTADCVQSLDALGFSTPEQSRVEQIADAQRGVVLVAGPAKSGRSTTLYALAHELRRRGRRVASLEDSVTFRFDGMKQIDVADATELTLAASVRAAIALDAGAVIVEVPSDRAAVEALVTSSAPRLILASLDAPDFVGVIDRLREMEIGPMSIAGSLIGVVSQRLLRRLCGTCAGVLHASDLPDAQQALLFGMPTSRLRQPVGCAECRGTGYVGRIAATEVVPITIEIAAAITRAANAAELSRLAREAGAHSLWDSGLHHVIDGTTSLGELLDTLPPPSSTNANDNQEDIDALLSQLLDSPIVQAKTAPKPPTMPARPVTPPALSRPTTTPSVARVIRVLVVDEDAGSRRVTADALKQRGLAVLEAADGAAALTYIEKLRPDVVLTDIAVPKVDAFGILTSLASIDKRPAVVIHTAQEDESLHAWLKESGAQTILPRSISADMLAKHLRDSANFQKP